MSVEVVHGVLVALRDQGVLLIGPSGSGKSSLALGLLDRGARLVADDAVLIESDGATRIGRCPEQLQGLLQISDFPGDGVFDVGAAMGASALATTAQVGWVVRMAPAAEIPNSLSGVSVIDVPAQPVIDLALWVDYAIRTAAQAGAGGQQLDLRHQRAVEAASVCS